MDHHVPQRPGNTWAYSQTTILDVRGRRPFEHTDAGLLTRVGPPVPNPLAAQGPAWTPPSVAIR